MRFPFLLTLTLALPACATSTTPGSDAAARDAGAARDAPDAYGACAALALCCPRVGIPEYRPYCESTVAAGDDSRCAPLLEDRGYCPSP